jgi:Uma2 family endonuclease
MNALTPAPRQFTRAEFERIARSGGFGDLRVELRRGWIVEMSPQYTPHMRLKMKLLAHLAEAIRPMRPPLEVGSEGSVAFGRTFEPMPDILVFDPAHVPPGFTGPIPGTAVKLIIEVASTTLADDLGDKLQEYAAAGLAEYWVADVAGRVVFRHDGPSANGYARRLVTPLAEQLESLTIAGLVIPAGVIA